MIDILEGKELEIKCLDKGFVRLIDVMPRLSDDGAADFAIVQAARVSYGNGTKTINEDRGLIRYLMRHQHTTPFEMVEFKFHCKMPIMVARQWIRHRTANVNEYSGRYSIIKDEYYIPTEDNVRKQSTKNKQGGEETFSEGEWFIQDLEGSARDAYDLYTKYLAEGVSREQARMVLPLNFYTEWYWKIDLHNLFHFLALRCDSHAQYEIRVFADAMLKLIEPVVPISLSAWNDYHTMRGAVKFTKLEVEQLKYILSHHQNLDQLNLDLNSNNKREDEEWKSKLDSLLSSRS